MQTLCRTAVLTALLAVAPIALSQSVYKWVDDDGVTQYTQQPPASGDAELIDPERSAPPPDTPTPDRADADDEAESDSDRELPGSVSEYCEEMRGRAETLASDAPLQIGDDDGNLQELSGEQRAERLEQARSQIEQHCADESA